MDRSARVFSMPSFWQQITPLRYTVLDWEQVREIPAISSNLEPLLYDVVQVCSHEVKLTTAACCEQAR